MLQATSSIFHAGGTDFGGENDGEDRGENPSLT